MKARREPCGGILTPPPSVPPRTMASDAGATVPIGTEIPAQTWIATCLELAAEHETGVPIDELASLLPPEGRMSETELARWLAGRPELAELRGGWAFAPGRAGAEFLERRERAEGFVRAARELVEGPLRGTLPWLRCVGITGSTAYGSADAADDLDFLIVARDGYLWLAVLRIYLAVRRPARNGGGAPRPRLCFNYVRDDATVRAEFAAARDRLFAREALTARILEGDAYYADLLASASWIGDHLPVVYARRRRGPGPSAPTPPRAPWLVRAANAAAFFAIATYLQVVGLRRNARLRRDGRPEAVFRTSTALGGLSFDSIRFETIRARYRSATPPPSPPVATGRGSDAVGARPIARGR